MSKQDELQYEQQEKRIQAQSDAFITLLTKRGILGDSRIDDAQKRAARQEKTKNCYHNTLMLLQHYRTLVWMLECFPETVATELDRPFEGVDKLIEDVDVEVALGNKKLESRMQGMQKSRLLMDRLNEALTVLRKKPDNGERLYMNNKDRKRQIAYEVLMILGMLALLTFICRLWPILLLIILGIFVAAIRLLFLSGNRFDQVEPQPLLPAPIPAQTESDLRKMAHSLIASRITTLVLNEYPNARWIWEAPNAFELIELGEEVYILLNRAGGYRKAKVIIQNLQVIGLQYQEIPKKPDESEKRTEAPATEQPKENYELIAFEWAESHIFELNARCNDAIGQGLTEILLTADDLPARESWENVCLELQRAGLEDAVCIAEGIKINLSH